MLEFQVALVLLGIALAGLFPLVALYSRGVTALEGRLPVKGNWNVVPSSDAWARKLGAAAQVTPATEISTPSPIVAVVDDGDPLNYSESGAWTPQSDSSVFGGQFHYCSSPGAAAAWTFCVPPGWYQIAVTWPPSTDTTWSALSPSTSAAYSISDGTVPGTLNQVGTTVNMDQTKTPGTQGLGGFSDANNFSWQYLHKAVLLTGPNVQVQLIAPSHGAVSASGVQLVPINNVTITSLTRTLEVSGGTGVTAQVTVTPGGPPQ